MALPLVLLEISGRKASVLPLLINCIIPLLPFPTVAISTSGRQPGWLTTLYRHNTVTDLPALLRPVVMYLPPPVIQHQLLLH
jgi:hypothetical protein